jgi:hypothetical protein
MGKHQRTISIKKEYALEVQKLLEDYAETFKLLNINTVSELVLVLGRWGRDPLVNFLDLCRKSGVSPATALMFQSKSKDSRSEPET